MVECQGSVREGQVCVGMSECILGVDGSDRGDGLRRSRRSRPVLVPFAAPSKLVARTTLLPLISFCSPLLNVCFSPAQRPLHGAKYRRGGEDIHRRELRRERNRRYQGLLCTLAWYTQTDARVCPSIPSCPCLCSSLGSHQLRFRTPSSTTRDIHPYELGGCERRV